MRLRFPIPAKISAWFICNLLLLAVGFWIVFHRQFGKPQSEMFGSIIAPKIQALAERISADLRENPPYSWDEKLKTHSRATGIEMALFNAPIMQQAGSRIAIPPALAERIKQEMTPERPNPVERGDDGPGGPRGPRFEDDGPPRPPRRPPPLISSADGNFPKMTMRTEKPTAYWAVVRIPVERMNQGYRPLLLVMRSDSLTGNGAFFDPKPWLYAGFGAVLVSILIWSPLALGLTRSLRRITTATAQIADGDFTTRVPDSDRADELGELGTSVNQMAERLDGFVRGQKRFMGDIAHELCTPIARMQAAHGILETSAADPRSQKYVASLGEEISEMSRLVEELLSFSKAALNQNVRIETVPLSPLVAHAIARETSDPAACNVRIPDQLAVQVEPTLLTRAVANVIRNALRYAGNTGPIEITAQTHGQSAELIIADNGPGVPETELPKLFDAFYRPDASRTRATGGAGLGLAIVRSCLEACSGTVSATNRPGGGLEISFTIPLAPTAPA